MLKRSLNLNISWVDLKSVRAVASSSKSRCDLPQTSCSLSTFLGLFFKLNFVQEIGSRDMPLARPLSDIPNGRFRWIATLEKAR